MYQNLYGHAELEYDQELIDSEFYSKLEQLGIRGVHVPKKIPEAIGDWIDTDTYAVGGCRRLSVYFYNEASFGRFISLLKTTSRYLSFLKGDFEANIEGDTEVKHWKYYLDGYKRAEALNITDTKVNYLPGTMIRLDHMDDPRPVADGTMGRVEYVDDLGTIHCSFFEDGKCEKGHNRQLGVVPEVDQFHIVSEGV